MKKVYILLMIAMIICGCNRKWNANEEAVLNNDIGKVANVYNTLYYINEGALYKSDSNNVIKEIELSNVYSLQTVNNTVYAIAYIDGNNVIYNISDNNNVIFEFKTDAVPDKVLMDDHTCYYMTKGQLYADSIDKIDALKSIEDVYDFTVTKEGVFYLVFSGNIGNSNDNFLDIGEISITSELCFSNLNNVTKIVDEINRYGSFLSNYGNKVTYRSEDKIFIADEKHNECVIENVLPSSIVVSGDKLYFGDLGSASIKEYSARDKITRKVGEYGELIGIANDELIKSDLSTVNISIEN